MRSFFVAFAVLGLSAGAHAADNVGDPIAGKKIANDLCAQCHDVTGNEKPRSPPGNAPPFISLAQSQDQTPQKLRRKLMLPHGRMVNLIMPGRDTENVISYILSLRKQ